MNNRLTLRPAHTMKIIEYEMIRINYVYLQRIYIEPNQSTYLQK